MKKLVNESLNEKQDNSSIIELLLRELDEWRKSLGMTTEIDDENSREIQEAYCRGRIDSLEHVLEELFPSSDKSEY
jgi:hypothetical protein